MKKNFFFSYGKAIVQKGYTAIPIKPGTKHPTLTNWQAAKPELVDEYIERYPGFGVGILTKYNPAIDIDFMDKEIVHTIEQYCIDMFGVAPIRVGKAPKELLLFQTDEPFTKLASKIYRDPLTEDKCQLEILCDGQQFVAYAEHPDTKKPYMWLDQMQPLHTPSNELPVLTYEKAELLINFIDNVLCKDWDLYNDNKTADVLPGASTSFDAAQRTDIFLSSSDKVEDATTQDLIEILATVDADDYPIWFKVGMALYHQYDGGDEGFDVWDDWSAKADNYDPKIMAKKWRTFKAENEKNPATVRYILKLAGMQPPSKKKVLDKMLENLIHVHVGDRVYDLGASPQIALSKTIECRSTYRNDFTPVKLKGKEVMKPAFMMWECNPERKHAHDVVYDPSRKRVYEEFNKQFVNEFFMREHLATTDTEFTNVFTDHFDYLFSDEVEREWFLDWLAFNVQRPWERSKVTPLIVATAHGTGRGWVVELLNALLGEWNVTNTKMSVLAGEGGAGAYQDFLHKSLVCAIHEIRETAKSRFTVNDRVRDYLDAPALELNLKYGAKQTVRIYTNFYLMTNHPDALVIPEEDRRINVLQGPGVAQEDSYYKRLYGSLKDQEGVRQFFWMLKRRDLTDFNYHTCMKTSSRSNMVNCSISETERSLNIVLTNLKYKFMEFGKIKSCCMQVLDDDQFYINRKELRHLLNNRLGKQVEVKYKGSTKRGYVMDSKITLSKSQIVEILEQQDSDSLLQ